MFFNYSTHLNPFDLTSDIPQSTPNLSKLMLDPVASGGYGVGWNNCCVAARTSTAVYFIVISTYYNLLI